MTRKAGHEVEDNPFPPYTIDKHIAVPDPITLGDKTYKFSDYVINNVLFDARFGRNFTTLSYAYELLTACQSPSELIELSEEAHKLACEVINEPHIMTPNGLVKGYTPGNAVHFMPFLKAIIEAK